MNIAMLLDVVADALPDRIALSDRDAAVDYATLRHMAAGGGSAVAARSEKTVVFLDEGGLGATVALFAAAWGGASFAPLNFRLPEQTIRSLLRGLDTSTLIHGPRAATIPDLVERPIATAEWLAGLQADSGATGAGYLPDPQTPAVTLYTSGTSAAPKAALLEHDNLLAYLLDTVEFASAGEDEATLVAVPPFHIAGVAGMLSSVYSGRRIVPLPRFDAAAWVEAAQREQATHAFLVPTMLARIVSHLEAQGGGALPSLRSLSYGGARMPAPVLERALELFPNAGFVNAYGLTETSSTVALLDPEDHRTALASADPAVRARLGSVGKPLPGVAIQVVDDSGRPVPADVEGRIRIRGAQVGGTYRGTAAEGRQPDGWLITGDLGMLDSDGYLFIRGRADDVIIAGGENLSPGEIEDVLLRHPAVDSAAVVGVPDEEWGERVAAMVTLRSDIASGELIEWVRGELGSLKTPKALLVREELPMTATGKILRREVREEFTRTIAPSRRDDGAI